MNAVLSTHEVARQMGVTHQGVSKIEARALEKLRFMAVLRRDFPPLPGETFEEWFGQLTALAKVLAIRSGRAGAQPK